MADKEALVGNAADKQQVSKGKQKEKIQRTMQLNEVRSIMATKEGRSFFHRYLVKAGVFEQSFTGDNNWTNFNEGKRSIGNMLLAEITEASPEHYLKMMQENR